jgi:hypothetical protein
MGSYKFYNAIFILWYKERRSISDSMSPIKSGLKFNSLALKYDSINNSSDSFRTAESTSVMKIKCSNIGNINIKWYVQLVYPKSTKFIPIEQSF